MPPQTFPEVDTFVTECADSYSLDVHRISLSMKLAFSKYLKNNPTVKAVFVGIRRTDPYGDSLEYFDPTNRGWPDFMRVHPILNWDYYEIWDVLSPLRFVFYGL
jgi:FAD synthetase